MNGVLQEKAKRILESITKDELEALLLKHGIEYSTCEEDLENCRQKLQEANEKINKLEVKVEDLEREIMGDNW